MKNWLFLVFVSISLLSWSQKGYDVIRKAEQKMEQGKYQKALRLLEKAESMNYGFCGNAWIEADEWILLTRAEIFSRTGENLRAIHLINDFSSMMMNSPDYVDSLKTVYCVKEFGKERVKREIDSCLAMISNETITDAVFSENMSIELRVNFLTEPFTLSYFSYLTRHLGKQEDEEEPLNTEIDVLERYRMALKARPFYQVLI